MKTNTKLMLGFLLVVAGILMFAIAGKTSATTITVDDDGEADYSKIQDAIDAAEEGDTIRVYAGTYAENPIVNKTVSLIGNGSETILDAGGRDTDMNGISVQWDLCNISGLNITHVDYSESGIDISANSTTIMDCIFTDGGRWIRVNGNENAIHGVLMDNAICFCGDNNRVENSSTPSIQFEGNGNAAINNILEGHGRGSCGINLRGNDNLAKNNILSETLGVFMEGNRNRVIGNTGTGGSHVAYVYSGDDNYIARNTCSGYFETGISVDNSVGTIIENNTCMDARGSWCEISGISLSNCNNCEVRHNTCKNFTEFGILVSHGGGHVITHNTCEALTSFGDCGIGIGVTETENNRIKHNRCDNNNNMGIFLRFCNHSIVSHNTCNDNANGGITLYGSSGNEIFENSCNKHKEGGIYIAKNCNDNNIHDNDAKVVKEGEKNGDGFIPGFGFIYTLIALLCWTFLTKRDSQ